MRSESTRNKEKRRKKKLKERKLNKYTPRFVKICSLDFYLVKNNINFLQYICVDYSSIFKIKNMNLIYCVQVMKI